MTRLTQIRNEAKDRWLMIDARKEVIKYLSDSIKDRDIASARSTLDMMISSGIVVLSEDRGNYSEEDYLSNCSQDHEVYHGPA